MGKATFAGPAEVRFQADAYFATLCGRPVVQSALDLIESPQRFRVYPHAGLGQANAVADASEQRRTEAMLLQPYFLADDAEVTPKA